MPRAGLGGGHSSSHRSSGGHSSSRSSGGHRISSSGSHSRAGSGRSPSSHAGSGFGSSSHRSGGPLSHSVPPPPPPRRGPGMPPPPPPVRGPGMPPPPPRRGFRRRSYHRTYSGGSSGGCLVTVVAMLIMIFVLIAVFSVFSSSILSIGSGRSSTPAITREREKLDSGLSFDSRCIVDEIGWFDSVSNAGRKLKTFYDKTGVQPYIVLLKYHPELETDDQKEAYAQDYYEDTIDNEATFLYMYFAEEDQDNEVGYMCYVNGKRVDSVMDTEAVDILWGYLDRNWYSDMSTDELFEDAFTRTAETVMAKSKSSTNVVFAVIIGIVIIGAIAAVITATSARRKNGQE